MCAGQDKGVPHHPHLAKYPHADLHERFDPLGDRSAQLRLRYFEAAHQGVDEMRTSDAALFVEVQLAATVRSTVCDDQWSHYYLPAQLSGAFRRAASCARFCLPPASTLFEPQLTAVLTNDAVGGRPI